MDNSNEEIDSRYDSTVDYSDDGQYKKNRANRRLKGGFLQATGYLNSHLNKGEHVIYRAHLSWIPCFINQIPFMLIGAIVGGCVWGFTNNFFLGSNIFLLVMLIGILSQIPQIYRNIATDIVITNQGLHSKHGLVMVQDDQFTPHNRINDAEIDINSLTQRIFHYANVNIVTIAGDDNGYAFKKVAKPHIFKQAVRAAGQRYGSGSFIDQRPDDRDVGRDGRHGRH